MWMMSFVPDSFLLYVINTILLVGAVGSFLTFFALNRILRWFPAIAPYYLILQVVSAVLLVAGIYFKGGYSVEMSWRDKVKEAEAKVAVAEEQSKDLNKKLEDERKKKQQVKIEYYNTVKTQIKEVEKIINGKCEIDPQVNELLNKAATNPGKAK
jgi:preprotein translocase subunit SecF